MKGSRLITFRLHPGLKDEKKALNVLSGLRKKGYSTRYVMTAALLALSDQPIPEPSAEGAYHAEMRRLVDELADYIQGLQAGGVEAIPNGIEQQRPSGRVSRALLDFLASEVVRGEED